MSGHHSTKITIPERTGELVDAFETEARQLDTLIVALRRQREGVAQDDVGSIQDSVYAIHRVLLTLEEARKRRRTLLEVVSGQGSSGSGRGESARVKASKERLISIARGLETELTLSRRVLESALESTDAELQTLLSGLGDSATYASEAEPAMAEPGRLVDRQV